MKQLFLVILSGILMFSGITHANFNSQVDIDSQTAIQVETLIADFFVTYVSLQEQNNAFTNKLLITRNKVVTVLNTVDVNNTTFYGLEYLVYLMDRTILEIENKQATLNTNQNVSVYIETDENSDIVIVTNTVTNPQIIDTTNNVNTQSTTSYSESTLSIIDFDEDKDLVILGGTRTGPVVKFELTANLEAIHISELSVGGSNSAFADLVDRVYIYDSEGKILAQQSVTTQYEDIYVDITLPKGQTDIYIALETAKIGYTQSATQGTSMNIQLDILESRGESSKRSVTSYPLRTASNSVYIQPIKINNVQLVSSYDGYQVPESLLGGGIDQDIGYLVLDTASNINTNRNNSRKADMQIHTIDITVQDNTTAGDFASSLYLVDISDGDRISGTVLSNGKVRFELSNESMGRIDNGNTMIYSITGAATLDNTRNESVRIYIDQVNTGAITYSIAGDSAIYTQLDLPRYRLDGVTVSE